MKIIYIVSLLVLASCSTSPDDFGREPSIVETCFDVRKDVIVCKDKDGDCYYSNLIGTKNQDVSCDEFDKRNPMKGK